MIKKRIVLKDYYLSICAIFKNEAPYLREWIEYHKMIGVEHFYLYNNFSNDNYLEVLAEYIESGLVSLIDWPMKQGQMSAYRNCVENYGDSTNWIGFIDLDEFIVPNHTDDLRISLKPFEDRPVIIAYWKYFGSSGFLKRDISGLVTEDFYLSWRKYADIGKYFYNTAFDYADDLDINNAMHCRWSKIGKIKLPPVNFYGKVICNGINKVDDDYPPVQINHYFTKSYEEYQIKRSRGDAYFESNPRDEAYFYMHDMQCQAADYNIRKYTIKLKKIMNKD